VYRKKRPAHAFPERQIRVWSAAAFVTVVLLCTGPLCLSLQAPKSRKALTQNEVIELLESGVPSARVEQLARQYGLAFDVTSDVASQLRDAGATDELVEALRKLSPKGPLPAPQPATPKSAARSEGPPVLLIEAMPGGAAVYVDDEPVGTTSASGRLKLSRLSAGEHRVRLSLAGHRDYESSVTLAVGETTSLAATLEVATAAGAANPSAAAAPGASPESAVRSASGPATLGVLLAPQAAAGRRGAYISDVAQDSPAEKAGLRSGFTILAIQDQPINSPQDAQQALGQFQPGATVRITYSDGQNLKTTQAQLAARSSASLAAAPTVPNPLVGTHGTAPVSFNVSHDHGAGGTNYCVGVMTIGEGMIRFRSANGIHSFDFPLSAVREARRNAVYLAVYGAFHIRLKTGGNYNFVLLNAAGQMQPPDAVLLAIDQALGR
jgi:hypothetical protein